MDSIDRLFRSGGQIGEDLLWYVALCGFDLAKVVETNTRGTSLNVGSSC
jgi:hypothetical protein